jgi:carbonic anhydrase
MASDLTPSAAWDELCRGNRRFVTGRLEHPHQDVLRRAETASSQTPFAIILGCMDSRVAAEIVFDRGIGDLAVVRTAGHVVDSGVLGSLEFGVLVLGVKLVVVLGHEGCGAIKAALEAHATGVMPGGYIRDIVERVTPSMVTAGHIDRSPNGLGLTALMEEHVRHTVHLIAERSAPIAMRIESGECGIVGVGYDLADGQVRVLESMGDIIGDQGNADPRAGAGAGAEI